MMSEVARREQRVFWEPSKATEEANGGFRTSFGRAPGGPEALKTFGPADWRGAPGLRPLTKLCCNPQCASRIPADLLIAKVLPSFSFA